MADEDDFEYQGDPYPPFVVTPEQRRRWDFCVQGAEGLFADLPEAERTVQVWSATRALYNSDIPTDPPGQPTPVAP